LNPGSSEAGRTTASRRSLAVLLLFFGGLQDERRGCGDGEVSVFGGVVEGDFVSVQMIAHVARERCALAIDEGRGPSTGDVKGIADERVTECRGVDSNLVWATGDDGNFDEGVAGVGVDVDATSFAAGGASVGRGGVEQTDGWVVDRSDWRFDHECVRYVDALHEGAIDFGDPALNECFGHRAERFARTREEDDAGCAASKSMEGRWFDFAFVLVANECKQCMGQVVATRENRQAAGLVDGQ